MVTSAQQAAMAAMASVMLEGAPPSGESLDALVVRCVQRLTSLPLHRRARFVQGLDLLASRAGVMVAMSGVRPFVALSRPAQQRCLEAWTHSSLPLVRAAFQSIRRLVLSVHYAHPGVMRIVDHSGPLHARTAQVPWEGPIPSTSDGAPSAVATLPVAEPSRLAIHDPVADSGVERMVVGSTLTQDVHRRADVVVIGTGAGGAVAAARLAAAGYEVVMLESGDWHPPTSFDGDEPALMERLYGDGALRTTDDAGIALLQGHAVGGSSLVNWMIMLRTPSYVLDEWGRDAGTVGMTPHDMAPVFERIEREVRAGLVPEDAHSANNRIVLDGARALGWRVSAGRINAVGCHRCGMCGVGCRYEAKQSTAVVHVPAALRDGATLYTGVAVERIEQRERDQGSPRAGIPPLKRVHARVHGTNRTVTIDAPLVVVAAGAVGTPVLLQRSGFGGGGVGDWLRLHPTTAVIGVYERPIVPGTGIPLSTMCDEFIQWQGSDYGFWIETPPMLPSFAAAVLPGHGPSHAARMQMLPQLGVLIGLTRDGAETTHSSGRVGVDRQGRVSIRYRLTGSDARRVQASLTAMARLHFAAGAQEVGTLHAHAPTIRRVEEAAQLSTWSVAPNRMPLFSAHVNGTCRIGTDPATSGATPDGERHGVRGLYISDGSLLPTALGVNPQETIMAIASLLTDRLVSQHRRVTQ
ncbi:MAG: hypothetical protein RLZZ621_2363 [Gemmatimonadota bacterium]